MKNNKIVFYDDTQEQQDEIIWQDISYELKREFEKNYYLLVGTCGRWDGKAKGGKFISSYADFQSAIAHLDYIKIYELNGHLYIDGYHHDGSDFYELKKLTDKGYEFASSNYFAHSRTLHNTIFNNNFYSKLPRLSQVMYG